MRYRLAINLDLMPLDEKNQPMYRGLNVHHSIDLEVADLREASNVLIEYHDLTEELRKKMNDRAIGPRLGDSQLG